MKKIIYSLVIMIAAGSLFTSCLEYVEPVGIQQLRSAKADYLDALGQLRLADAELQKANAAYVNARAAYVDAQTEWQLIENRIHEYDVQIKAARTEYEVDSLTKLKELLQVQHDTGMANARAALANAEEDLRVTLRNIAAVQNLFTVGERTVFANVLGRYEAAFNAYNEQLNVVEQAKATLWELEYRLNDSTDWVVNFQGQVDFFAGEVDRAQAALEAVPEKLDLEDWKAEVDNLQDSIDAINYSRAALRRDSVNYMINTWCEANIGYEEERQAAKDKYTEDLAAIEVVTYPGPAPADPGAEPVRADYDGKGNYKDSVAFPELTATTAQYASSKVYQQFADLVGLYAHTAAPVGNDSTTAFAWAVPTAAGYKAGLESDATVAMINFLFGEEGVETPRTFTYKDKAFNTDRTLENSRYIGLYGAHSVLDRYLVLTEGDQLALEAAEKAAHLADSIYWAHRDILVAGKEGYQPLIDAIADSVVTYNALQQAKADAKARAQALVNAGKELATGTAKEGAIANYSFAYGASHIANPTASINPDDTTRLLAAIKSFAAARIAFFEPDIALTNANKATNYLTYRDKLTNVLYTIRLDSVERAGYFQKTSDVFAHHKVYSEYSYDRYQTEADEELTTRRPHNSIADGPKPWKFDAMLRTVNCLTQPHAIWANWDKVDHRYNNVGETWTTFNLYGYTYNQNSEYFFKDGFWFDFIPKSVKDADNAHTAAKAEVTAKEAEYEAIYKLFWNQAYAIPELPINWADETFTVPDNLIIFTSTDEIRWNERLGAVLSFLETDGAQPATYYRGTGDVLTNSNIFGGTEYFEKLLKEFKRDFIKGGQNNIEALQRIKDWIDACMDKVETERTKADTKAFNTAKTNWTAAKKAYDEYPGKLAAYNAYVAEVNALKEAFYGIKEYDADGNPVFFTTEVSKIPAPTAGTYEVDPIIKDWKYNTKYFGGKQLELAQKWHGDYPETLQGFDERAYFITHTIYHLTTIKGILDNAYTAAAKIYTYDWEKYTYTEPTTPHEYKIKIEEMTQDLGANAASNFAAIIANYNTYQKEYKEAWELYLEKCTGELGYWKKLLAQFKAGYNPIEMAVKLQRDKVAKAEEKLAILQKALELAEAEYQAIIDQLLK